MSLDAQLDVNDLLRLALNEKTSRDMALRLDIFGLPLHPGNDYERHLFAHKLKLEGKDRDEVREALFALGLEDVAEDKRDKYVEDVLDSILVGFSDNPLSIYMEVK